MRKVILAVLLCLGVLSANAQEKSAAVKPETAVKAAKTAPKSVQPKPLSAETREKIDKIQRGVMDVEAAYWAWYVTEVKEVSLNELRKNSERWIMKPETRKELFGKIEAIIKENKVRELTNAERQSFDKSKMDIRRLLNATEPEVSCRIGVTEKEAVELESLYWAYKIGEVKALSAEQFEEQMNQWPCSEKYREKLMARVMNRLTRKDYRKLMPGEKEKYEAMTAKK